MSLADPEHNHTIYE
jgi:hypothetical protein